VPRERYLLGFPYGGYTIQNGEYAMYLGSKVYLGEVDGNNSEKLERVKSFFAKADIQTAAHYRSLRQRARRTAL
jgi:hypothetical protein